MTFRVLVTARSFARNPGQHHEYLREQGCLVEFQAGENPLTAAQLGEIIPGCDGVILSLDNCDASVIARADRLKVISRYGAGYDNIDLDAAAQRGIAVTWTPGANKNGVAELTLGLLFSLARHLPEVTTATHGGIWRRVQGWEITGKTLGIIGYGAIGHSVAEKAAALGMYILYYDPYKFDTSGMVRKVELAELLANSDVVTLHAALTHETTRMINHETLNQMKPGAYLINAARGEIVDEDALYEALTSGRLAGAAVDVLVDDPPVNNRLLALDNLIATPHIGATTNESIAKVALMAAENLVNVLKGEPCANIVNQPAWRNIHG